MYSLRDKMFADEEEQEVVIKNTQEREILGHALTHLGEVVKEGHEISSFDIYQGQPNYYRGSNVYETTIELTYIQQYD